ncbi:MAG: LCP family protein [Chloroflexi bacterium]|nr:LCP family protein [Chloroflexota bacterium]MCL5109024.1 LCP family protein [Chloroflexota bacterium]
MGFLRGTSHSSRRAEARRFPLKQAALLAFIACFLGGGLLFAAANGFGPAAALLDNGAEGSNGPQEQRSGADTSSVVATAPADTVPLPQKAASDPRYAFLLMGYGGGGHEGAYLSDSMMVVIVDPSQKTLTMLSLPRDIWAPLVFDGKTAVYNKLNTAYAFARDSSLYRNRLARYSGKNGAGRFATDTVSRLLGIPIANYLALDFQGFREMIDAVGGIDVAVPASFSARYPANDDPTIDSSWITVRFTKGTEHMSGERAIRFARARETLDNVAEGSDFARSRRQRLIMEAFKNKVMTAGGLLAVPKLLGIASQHVDTDYSLPDAAQFARLALEWKDMRIYQTALTLGNYLQEATGPQGAYILVPDEPDLSWSRVRAFAQRLWQNPAGGIAMAANKITVENTSGVSGMATQVTDLLYQMGYQVNAPASGEEMQQDWRLLDGSGGEGKALAPLLEKDLNRKIDVVAGPDGDPTGVVLMVGSSDVNLAGLRAPADARAPLSAAGVTHAGAWVPQVPPTATQTALATAKVTVTVNATASTSPTAALSPLPARSPTITPSPGRTAAATATAPAGTSTATATQLARSSTPTPSLATATRTPTSTPTTAAGTATRTPTRTATVGSAGVTATSVATPTSPAPTATPKKSATP